MTFGAGSLGTGSVTAAPRLERAPVMPKARAKNYRQHGDGDYGTVVCVMRFMRWAIERQHFPMPEDVISRFGCCPATAHRWLNALEECYGVERPRRGFGGRGRER